MMHIKYKYRSRYAEILLFSYLFLVGLSILHYHHVDIQEGNYSYASQTGETDAGPFDKLIDATHECTIQQFASTVLNYNFTTVFDQIKSPGEQEFKLIEILSHPVKSHHQNRRFRAPPLTFQFI